MKTNLNYKVRLAAITTFVFDVDGVFTNGEIFFREEGETIRALNAKDGYAITTALEKGFQIAVITRGDSKIVKELFEKIGVERVFLNVMNKGKVFTEYLEEHNLSKDEVLYMGDDIPDFECLQLAGVGTCPRDAVKELRLISDYVSTFKGGKGAVRDVIEQTMRVQGKWFVPKI